MMNVKIKESVGNTTGLFLFFVILVGYQDSSLAQSGVQYTGNKTFLNGSNVAWINFAGDLGPRSSTSLNNVAFSQFQTMFKTIHDNGGNSMRLWLHTNGAETPVFDSSGYVTGPGPYAIQDLKRILNLAQQDDIGLILCLWSFDMMKAVGSEAGLTQTQQNDNYDLLTDTSYTMAYIRNALAPMVDSVRGNAAIIAWEIFNEPEGMSDEFGAGWGTKLVPMADIQRCVNLMAGAIHRADPSASVTSGAWAFQSLSDVTPLLTTRKSWLKELSSISPARLRVMTDQFNSTYRTNMSGEQFMEYLDRIAATGDYNYYRDDRLIAAGGDSLGTLDFYCVHYYTWMGIAFAPFLVGCSTWDLTKPLVVAEFEFSNILGSGLFSGLTSLAIYPDIYSNGYAGALNWAWTSASEHSETLQAMSSLSDSYPGNMQINIVDQALGAKVMASSNDTLADRSSSPQNITDGDLSSAWVASADSTQWLLLDLGRQDTVARIQINWANGSFAGQLSVEVSKDLDTWTTVDSTIPANEGTFPVQYLNNLMAIGRYIRFLMEGEGRVPYSISEIEVYGSAGAATVVQTDPGVPTKYELLQNYPNPFNPSTVIQFSVPRSALVTLKVYDVLGREVRTLVNRVEQPGSCSVTFDASGLPSGVYFYRIETGRFTETKKLMLIR